jgi:heme a synthase
MRTPAVSPSAYRRVTALALAALVFIVVTGGAVRLTGSGLGCPDWPTCADERVVPPWEYHAMVEFVNRTVTGLVSLAVMLAVLGSVFRRPRRRDLVWLSVGLVAGVVGQIVLGGLTVLFELKPQFVMAHFLLSMVLLANAVVLHHRAARPPGPSRPVVDRDLNLLGRAVVVAAAMVLFLGTVVTSSGPHGGDPEAERLSFFLPDVARLHGIGVALFLVVTLVAVLRVVRARGPAVLMRRGEVLLAVLVAQALVGYVQYFTGVPALLVGVHIAGAAAVWVATLRFFLSMSAPPGGGDRATGRTPAEVLATRG